MKNILILLFMFFSFSCFAEEKLLFQPNEFLKLSYDEIVKIYPDIKDFEAVLYLKNEDCKASIQKIENVYYVLFFNSCFCGSAGCLMEIYKDNDILFSKFVGGDIILDGNKIILPDLGREFTLKKIK